MCRVGVVEGLQYDYFISLYQVYYSGICPEQEDSEYGKLCQVVEKQTLAIDVWSLSLSFMRLDISKLGTFIACVKA